MVMDQTNGPGFKVLDLVSGPFIQGVLDPGERVSDPVK